MSYHIVNARIVNEGEVIEGDVVIEGERITGVGASAPANATVVDRHARTNSCAQIVGRWPDRAM